MLTALIQMALLIACGTAWRYYAPDHIPALAHRRALTDLVFYILLPALVLNVIWQAPLNATSFHISIVATTGLVVGLSLMFLISQLLNVTNKQKGALLLAAAFPNATYLGLPVLTQVVGPESRALVLQYDYFACTPILLTVGILIAQHYSVVTKKTNPIRELIKIPPLWALALGMGLNFAAVKQAPIIEASLSLLAGGVVPLMLIVLGMSIPWQSLQFRFIKLLLPVAAISLFIVPLSVYAMTHIIGIPSETSLVLTLVAAMPTMVFGIVICERYQLDSELYAAAVALTTLSGLVSLPIWFTYLSAS